jgi:NADPH2:quinone reductase
MKAIQLSEYGPPDVMQYVEVEEPDVKLGEIKVKVKAAGVNPLDCKIRDGSSFLAEKLQSHFPIGIGYDLSGTIVEVGPNVSGWSVGDDVVGLTISLERPGSYAEYAIVDAKSIVKKPSNLSFETAAAIPTPGPTAWQAVHKYAKISKKDKVLIHAGAGGVGHLAVQFAKQLGAYVISTAKGEDHELLKGYGVDEVIDFTTTHFKEVVQDLDIVIDLVGGKTGIDSLDVLKPTGTLVTVPTYSQKEVLEAAENKNINAIDFVVFNDMSSFAEVVRSVAKKEVKVNLATPLKLKEAIKAHEMIASFTTNGKIVLQIG